MSLLNPINGARYLGGGAMRGTGYGVAKFGEGGEWLFGLIKNAGYSLHAYGVAHQLLAQAISVKGPDGQFIMNAGVLADQLRLLASAGIEPEFFQLQSNGSWQAVKQPQPQQQSQQQPPQQQQQPPQTQQQQPQQQRQPPQQQQMTAEELAVLTMSIAE